MTAVVMANVDGDHDGATFRRLAPDETTPALLFMDRRPVAAAEAALDPDDESAREGLRLLDLVEPAPGEGYRAVLPYRLADAFALPTEAEIAEVRAMWAARDVAARLTAWVARFANVVVNRGVAGSIADPTEPAQEEMETPSGIVRRWRVSTSSSEDRLDPVGQIDPEIGHRARGCESGSGDFRL